MIGADIGCTRAKGTAIRNCDVHPEAPSKQQWSVHSNVRAPFYGLAGQTDQRDL